MIKSAPGGRYACNVIDNALLKLEEHRQEIAEDRLQHFLDTWPQQFADRDPDNEALGSLVTFFAQKDNTVQTSPSASAAPRCAAHWTARGRILCVVGRASAASCMLVYLCTYLLCRQCTQRQREFTLGAWRPGMH